MEPEGHTVAGRPGPPVAGLLLTGGASRRMGFDKASMLVRGTPLAVRLGYVLDFVASPALEVGPGRSFLEAVREDPPGGGPLVALVAGAAALRSRGVAGPVVVVACDLPLLTTLALSVLARWPGDGSVVPVIGGVPQPLASRWSPADLGTAARLVAAGERSMRALLAAASPEVAEEGAWPPGAAARAFADADLPEDLESLGLPVVPGAGSRARSVPASRPAPGGAAS